MCCGTFSYFSDRARVCELGAVSMNGKQKSCSLVTISTAQWRLRKKAEGKKFRQPGFAWPASKQAKQRANERAVRDQCFESTCLYAQIALATNNALPHLGQLSDQIRSCFSKTNIAIFNSTLLQALVQTLEKQRNRVTVSVVSRDRGGLIIENLSQKLKF